MKLRILEGPTFGEISTGIEQLVQNGRPTFIFKVRPVSARLTIPDVSITAKEIRLDQTDNQPKFHITGRSKEGDKCKMIYRPLGEKKGVMRLSD